MKLLLCTASPIRSNAYLVRRRVSTPTADLAFSSSSSSSLSPKPAPSVRRLHLLYVAPCASPLLPPSSPCIPRAAAEDIIYNAGAAGGLMACAYALVLTFDKLTQRNIISQSLSRKLVHILSGLLFVVSWPIFSTSTEARYFASLIPLVNCLRLVIHGLSLASDEGLIKSVTREGKPEELLRGPIYYVLVLILCSLVFWRESPVGLIAVAMMCGGDGVADIMGRRFGSVKIPYNQQKSWAGSISMLVFGFLISIGMLYYYTLLGYFQLDWSSTIQKVALVSLVATVVESLPTTQVVDDNISVPLVSIAAALLTIGF